MRLFPAFIRWGVVAGAMSLCLQTPAATAIDEKPVREYGAREIAAILDMQAMRDAEIIAYLDTNYIHTLENLNDIIGAVPNYFFDDIMDQGGAQVLDTNTADFRPQRLDVRIPPNVWLGPYVSFQQGRWSIDGAGYDPGTPIDPWDSPYYLFSPIGLVRPTLGTVTLELYGDYFNEYTIVSLGPDGRMSEDDIMVGFGGGFPLPRRTVLSSLRPSSGPPGQPITIRGYNFGSAQDESTVDLGGQPIPQSSILSWSGTEILFRIPSGAGSGDVVVNRGYTQSNTFRLEVTTPARHWLLYR